MCFGNFKDQYSDPVRGLIFEAKHQTHPLPTRGGVGGLYSPLQLYNAYGVIGTQITPSIKGNRFDRFFAVSLQII